METYRQGDVLVVRVEAGPTAMAKTDHKVLAYGEVTGHSHRFEEQGNTVVAYGEKEVDRFEVNDQPAKLLHQEHGTIEFAPGTYDVVRQMEFSPSRDMVRVAD